MYLRPVAAALVERDLQALAATLDLKPEQQSPSMLLWSH